MLTRRAFLGGLGSWFAIGRSALASQAAAFQPVEIHPRESWGADRPPREPPIPEDVRLLLVHHSATANDYRPDEVPKIIAGFYDYHTGGVKAWSDIAYNFLVDRFGGVWEGRAGSLAGPVVGDATGGNQGFSQLVCLIGNFEDDPPSDEASTALVGVLAWLAERDDVATSPGSEASFVSRGSNRWPRGRRVTSPTIAGHRDMSLTTCPGSRLYDYVISALPGDVESVKQRRSAAQPNGRGRRRPPGVREL